MNQQCAKCGCPRLNNVERHYITCSRYRAWVTKRRSLRRRKRFGIRIAAPHCEHPSIDISTGCCIRCGR